MVEIRVFDPEFNVIKVITEKDEVARVLALWEVAEESSEISLHPLESRDLYKVDFYSESSPLSGRWLYVESGHYQRLSKSRMETFKVKKVSELNERLGI
ncbi:hypothetical protein EZV61_19360 [Corallincola luteus]|uniref:Phage protein n=1 Tax=Corallincola luteus TaxID=1775177 RepID=A0ABY2AFT4_9GAMM|nr:hypothetical protein [Corallincola luteus]TCI01063.1 hypothetical protein EZV61_19360 [Corallincola luteus]